MTLMENKQFHSGDLDKSGEKAFNTLEERLLSLLAWTVLDTRWTVYT